MRYAHILGQDSATQHEYENNCCLISIKGIFTGFVWVP